MSPVDTTSVKLRRSTLDRIATAYAEAVAAGDFDAAEGWIATAAFAADRQGDRRQGLFARPSTRSSTNAPNRATERASDSFSPRSNLNPLPPSMA